MDSTELFLFWITITALIFYLYPIVGYVYVAIIMTRMMKKVNPENHKIFKANITKSCMIVEFIMILRVVIFYLNFYHGITD